MHDASTLLHAGQSHKVSLEGAHLFGSTATELGHFDAISVRGGAESFAFRDSEVEGRVIFTDGERGGDPQAPVTTLDLSRDWLSKSPSAGIYFGSLPRQGGEPDRRGVFGAMQDVHIWDYSGDGRVEQIFDGGRMISHYDQDINGRPERIDVLENNVVYGPPGAGEASPAQAWRDRHPYDSWRSFFDFQAG